METLFEMEPHEESGLKLNQAQRRAITHGEGPLLVIAGAGTGKTRVITERIRQLLDANPDLTGENILGLTFTKKAAGEMKARVVKSAGERGKAVTLDTFHGFLESLLKDTDPQRVLLGREDHWILLRRNLARLKLDKYRRLAEPGEFLSDFVEFFSRCQDELVSAGDYQQYADTLASELQEELAFVDADTLSEREEMVAREHEIARAYRASEELLREKKRVSFGSLSPSAVALLETDAALRESLQQRFRYILVDEFQDTNIAQMRLLELLAGELRNIFAVGDNDQAIYRFRGASFASFQLFLQKFAGWKAGDDSHKFRVTLMENYRSTPNILRVATQVIGQNTVSADFPKKSLSATRSEGEKIRIVELASEEEEARWVAGELQRTHAAGRRWMDCAVLYRQHAHRDELVRELSARKIPFVISRLSILDHPLVKDVLAYLRLIARPFDDIACARVLSAPAWNFQAKDLARLAEFIEYLDYFEQAGGVIALEDDAPADTVKLMTVHGAKGLEFPHVFVLRVNNRKFPANERPRVFEFPARLMKEGEPAEQFHIQEERRLFYVALTRAQERLTLTSLTEPKGKVPVFIEDILMDPAVRRRDVRQLMPKLPPVPEKAAAKGLESGSLELFPSTEDPAKIFSRIADWAETFHPPPLEPLTLSPSAVNGYRTCPQQYLFGYLWSLKEGPRASLSFGS